MSLEQPVRWVEGPNRQFEKMMRSCKDASFSNDIVFMKIRIYARSKGNHFAIFLEGIEKAAALRNLR